MYKAVEAICMAQQADWNGLPAFVTAFNQFTAKLQELDQAAYNQNIATVGVSAVRDQLLETTIDQAHLVGNALRAFAAASNNLLLAEQLDFSRSDFRRGGYQLTLQFIDRVLINVNSHLPALTDYGILQEHVDTLAALRQQLGSTIGSPREAIVDRRQETMEIDNSLMNWTTSCATISTGSSKY